MAALLLVAACSNAPAQHAAIDPPDDAECTLDGMVLADVPGPKAQVLYAEGKPEFFCDLIELFAAVLAPEQQRAVTALYVQDMGKANWDRPRGNWIAARTAVYVVGSRKTGSMGPTFGSFADADAAAAFARQQGGTVLRFDEITPAMLDQHAPTTAQSPAQSLATDRHALASPLADGNRPAK